MNPQQVRKMLLQTLDDQRMTRGERNRENFLVTGDPRFVEGYARLFDELWEEFS